MFGTHNFDTYLMVFRGVYGVPIYKTIGNWMTTIRIKAKIAVADKI